MTNDYESLVGWRYLLRRQKQPRIMRWGLAIGALGLITLWIGFHVESTNGNEVSIFGHWTTGRILMATGGVIAAVSIAITLFGLLNRSMTLFSAFSTFMVAVGVAEVILVLAIMNGLHQDLAQKIIATKAHIIVSSSRLDRGIEKYESVTANILKVPGVLGATPMLETDVMVMSEINRVPTKLVGVRSGDLAQTSSIPSQMKEGCVGILDARRSVCGTDLSKTTQKPKTLEEPRNLMPSHKRPTADPMAFPQPSVKTSVSMPRVVIGAEMKRNLASQMGETLWFVSPFGELTPTGPVPTKEGFKIGGIFASGMLEFDAHLAFADLGVIQRLLSFGERVNSIQVKVADFENSDKIAARLTEKLGPAFEVQDWRERDASLFSALQLEKVAMFIVLGINILLAAFSIVSTLVMTILERRKEVAIFTAMGADRYSIFRIFVTQGAMVGVLGGLLGVLIGGGLSFALQKLDLPLNQEVYYITAVPVSISVLEVALVFVLALVVSILATLYPARLAAKLNPVEGLAS